MKTFFKNIGNTIVKKLRKHPLICNFVLSVVLAFVLEVLGRQTFDLSAVGFVDQRSKMFLYSIFIIFVTYSVTLITKRRLFSYIIVTLLWSIVGIVNFMMLSSRNTPFTYVDITLMKSVLPVMNNYFSPLEIGAMGALLLIALVLLVVAYMYLPIEEHLNRKSGFIKVIVIIAVFSGVTSYGFKSGMLVDQIHNIRIAFSDYGTPYCFSITALKNGIDKPSDYSEKKIKKIEKRTQKKVAKMKNEKVKKPNIIFVQLESHFDITQVKGVKFNKDPLPNFHKYMKGYSSGQLSMPSYGAGTANSEFEFLTGNSMAFFPNGSVPYLQYIRDGISTIVPQLEEYGYTTYGTHPYRAKGWNREFIYDLMGFDYRYFQGSFPFEDKLRNYVSDEADFKSILEWRNNTEGPFFMFNVTMQNHSNYGGDFDNFDPQIVAKFKNTSSNKYLNKYLSLMYETDQDVASLLSELSQSDRKTIVVFWGDHQPNDYVVRPIYKEYGLDFDNQTYEQQQQRQKTPFFIWANYDIQEQTNVEISLNYLNILLFETAGLQLDEYQTFRKNLWQGQIPMMNAVGYRNDNGDLVEYDDAPEEIQNLLNEYQNIQYYRMEREYSKKK